MAAETQVTIVVALQDNPQGVEDKWLNGYSNPREGMVKLAKLIEAVASGVEQGKVIASIDKADGTAGTVTYTCTQANADADDYCTCCGVTFTVKASPSSNPADGEFAAITDDNTMATALGAAMNAHPALKGLCTFAVATNVVTATMTNKGVHNNIGTATTSDATAIAVGADNFANGAIGTVQAEQRCFRGSMA